MSNGLKDYFPFKSDDFLNTSNENSNNKYGNHNSVTSFN